MHSHTSANAAVRAVIARGPTLPTSGGLSTFGKWVNAWHAPHPCTWPQHEKRVVLQHTQQRNPPHPRTSRPCPRSLHPQSREFEHRARLSLASSSSHASVRTWLQPEVPTPRVCNSVCGGGLLSCGHLHTHDTSRPREMQSPLSSRARG
jgi:hypothetical protein